LILGIGRPRTLVEGRQSLFRKDKGTCATTTPRIETRRFVIGWKGVSSRIVGKREEVSKALIEDI
jgi:hypothetical protein